MLIGIPPSLPSVGPKAGRVEVVVRPFWKKGTARKVGSG
jgi:hypothetical protein